MKKFVLLVVVVLVFGFTTFGIAEEGKKYELISGVYSGIEFDGTDIYLLTAGEDSIGTVTVYESYTKYTRNNPAQYALRSYEVSSDGISEYRFVIHDDYCIEVEVQKGKLYLTDLNLVEGLQAKYETAQPN